MLFFQQKNVSFVFYLSLLTSIALFLVELRWRAAYFLFFSVFLLLYIPTLWTWQLIQTKYFRQQGYRKKFRFPLIAFLVVVAMRFPAKITSSCIWVAIPVDWVILHWYACDADGRSVYGHVITKFSRMVRLLHFLTHGAPLARFARETSAMTTHMSLAISCYWWNGCTKEI